MKSIEDQIKFVDKVLLPFFGIKSIIDYESTFEITSEIDLISFNLIISEFREIFPAKEFSLHKTKYKIETSNQALCLLKKCMELIQLPYTVDTITHNKMSFKQVRLIQTNTNLYKYIQVKMSEIRSQELSSNFPSGLINIYRPNGVNTIGTSLKSPTCDIKEDLSKPTYDVSPWMSASYEPDLAYDLKPPKDLPITLQHEDLLCAVENELIHTTNLTSARVIDKDGVCTINLKTCDFYDKYVNSIKCSFESQKMNGENIISKYFIDTIVQGAEYTIYIGGGELVTGIFYNNKELLPEGGDSSKQMFLCNKILIHHDVFLKIKFDKNHHSGLKFVDIVLTTQLVDLKQDMDASLIETALYGTHLFGTSSTKKINKINNVSGVEQLIKNEKQLWNKSRIMAGMHGNAYSIFLEKNHLDRLTKCDPCKPQEKQPKTTIKQGNLIGYQNMNLEIPVNDYHFCLTSVLKKYSQFDINVSYSFTQLDDTFVHRYEIQYEKHNMFMYGENNPREFYGIGNFVITCDNIVLQTIGDIKLYALVVNKFDTIKMQNIALEYTIDLNDIVVSSSQFLSINKCNEFRGLLLEITSNIKQEPLPNIITVVNDEYAFCPEIRRHFAQHDVTLFDIDKMVVKK